MERTNNQTTIVENPVNKPDFNQISVINDSVDFVFINKKTEKLAAALYAITGFFQDEDPLKWKLRRLGTELLSAGLLLKDMCGDREKAIISSRHLITEISSLLLVAKHAGLISDMNHEVIEREFKLLESRMSSPRDVFASPTDGHISNAFFEVPEYGTQAKTEAQKENITPPTISESPRYIKDIPLEVPTPSKSTLETVDYSSNKEIDIATNKGHMIDENTLAHMGRPNDQKTAKPLKEFGAVAVKKNSRQSIIIGLLKRKKEIMIKDVSPLIEGVSEKTIQRELLAMVEGGVLKKEGEKRWSKYSLAS